MVIKDKEIWIGKGQERDIVVRFTPPKGPGQEFELTRSEADDLLKRLWEHIYDRPDTVTTTEAARELGVTPERIRKLVVEQRIVGAFKAGRQWLIPHPIEIMPGNKGPLGIAGNRN